MLTATPFVPLDHTDAPELPAPHITHQRQGQQVPVERAVAQFPQVTPLAFHPAFPFLAILAVPVSVRVPFTNIAYPAGSSVIPVFTVRSV